MANVTETAISSSKDERMCLSEWMRWKQDLDTDLVWLSIVRLESSMAPRILTLSESGIAVPATFTGIEPGRDLTR